MTARMHSKFPPLSPFAPRLVQEEPDPFAGDWPLPKFAQDPLTLRRHLQAQAAAQRHAKALSDAKLDACLKAWESAA